MALLFEYGEWKPVKEVAQLKELLKSIWSNPFEDEENEEGQDDHYQPFVQFDDDKIRGNNYIGFIQHGEELIEIYPKVFRNLENPSKHLMLQHIFYWFSYCRKWRFPFNQANLDNREIDQFPELIIHLIARQFLDTVSAQPLMQYQLVEESLSSPRGSINFGRYISKGLSTGNYQKVECDHEPFLFDNRVNRIIKYCVRLLLNQTKLTDNQRLLQEVIFVLDEVEDLPVTAAEIESIGLNSFYSDYQLILDMCRSIILQNVYSHTSYDTSHWCMLLPMEYVFEDFVAGFLESHFSNTWKIEYQKSDSYLTSNPTAFQMQHDIFLTSRSILERKIIIDTKYKIRTFALDDKKKGVSQSDLYQVVSYAFRRGCTEVILIYPNANEIISEPQLFEIHSGFDNHIVQVKVVEIPFWSMANYDLIEANLKKVINGFLTPN